MISKNDFREAWERLEGAFGRPSNSPEKRFEGMWRELRHLDRQAFSWAVSSWVQGHGGRYSGNRFPYPSDLLKAAAEYEGGQAKPRSRSIRPGAPETKAWADMDDGELLDYCETLEGLHKENYNKAKAMPKTGSGLGFMALDILLKTSYVKARQEWERRNR